jgi:hypothetical protein
MDFIAVNQRFNFSHTPVCGNQQGFFRHPLGQAIIGSGEACRAVELSFGCQGFSPENLQDIPRDFPVVARIQ